MRIYVFRSLFFNFLLLLVKLFSTFAGVGHLTVVFSWGLCTATMLHCTGEDSDRICYGFMNECMSDFAIHTCSFEFRD